MSDESTEKPRFFIEVKAGSNPAVTLDVHTLTIDDLDDLEKFVDKPWAEIAAAFDAGTLRVRERVALAAAALIRAGLAKSYDEVFADLRKEAFADVTLTPLGSDPTPPVETPDGSPQSSEKSAAKPKTRAARTSPNSQSATA